ncbi:hypothetical protein GCM10025767_35590 [Thalassotalea piscium]
MVRAAYYQYLVKCTAFVDNTVNYLLRYLNNNRIIIHLTGQAFYLMVDHRLNAYEYDRPLVHHVDCNS